MALHLGVSLGSASFQGTRAPLNSSSTGPSTSRGRPRVTCQAAFGAPKPGTQRIREQSPSKVQALAAPAIEREVLAQAPPSPPQQPIEASSNILEVRRADLERLIRREAAPDSDGARRQQQQQQQEQQHPASAVAEGSADDRQRQAAGVSGPRSLQQQQWQEQRSLRLVPSTRQARGGAASAAAARAAAAQAAAAARRNPVAKATAVTSWVLDCSSRRARCAKAPLAPAGVGAARARRGAAAAEDLAAEPRLCLEPASLDGLSEQTRQDMAVLIEARAALRHGRVGKARSSRGAAPEPDSGSNISAYMAALGNTGVLTRVQEARLSVILQKGLALERLGEAVAAARGCPPAAVAPADLAAAGGAESAADAAQRLANQREAKDLLMQHNVRLVVNIAKRYTGNGIELADLIPEGMVGLSKSLDRFDPSKGFKFSTYAHWWIRQAISRAVCDQARAVRLPSHVCEVLSRINRATTTLAEQSESDEPPSYEAIAAATGLPLRRVAHYLRLARLPGGPQPHERPSSFLQGSSLKEVQYESLEELAEDDGFCGEESEEEAAAHDTLRRTTDLLLSTLEKRERNILRLRYGLLGPWAAPDDDEGGLAGGGGAMSLGEVACAYGLSRERIRQIEDKAMRALRKPWRQQLAEQVSGGIPMSPDSLCALASAQALTAHEE